MRDAGSCCAVRRRCQRRRRCGARSRPARRREQRRALLAHQRLRLRIRGHRGGDVLVRHLHPRGQVDRAPGRRTGRHQSPRSSVSAGAAAQPRRPAALPCTRPASARSAARSRADGAAGQASASASSGGSEVRAAYRMSAHGRSRVGVAARHGGQLALRGLRAAQLVEQHVDDRRGQQRQHLAGDQAADDGDAQRPAQLGAFAEADRQRQRAERRRPASSSGSGRKRSRQASRTASYGREAARCARPRARSR